MKVLKKNAIKAYKAFNADWTCRGFQYEVGNTYNADGEIRLCEKGFHACENASDCFSYYPFCQTTKVAEVLCWGDIEKADDSTKLCCSFIMIVRELCWDEVLRICNSGNRNIGIYNSGNHNSGNCNTGSWNSGSRNTGDMNSGYSNSGNGNSGSGNSGNWNYGHWNSGNFNSGNCNTGSWNSGNYNSGYFNTPAQNQFFCFNKLTEKQPIDFPDFLNFDLTVWVPVATMTADEKNNHPECDALGGYLKEVAYKEAFRKSFFKAKEKDNWPDELAKLKAIPNFNYDIFEEISGISKEELES